jgi:hypothetical protein
MRNLKDVLAVVAIIVFTALMPRLFPADMHNVIFAVFIVLVVIFQMCSFSGRSKLSWKRFYTSSFNILTTKNTLKLDFEFDQKTLFEKAKEVLITNGYKHLIIDESRKLILVKERISFKSWGENIYVTILGKDNGNSELVYESVAFQIYTWGKNEDNGTKFLANMEESFII